MAEEPKAAKIIPFPVSRIRRQPAEPTDTPMGAGPEEGKPPLEGQHPSVEEPLASGEELDQMPDLFGVPEEQKESPPTVRRRGPRKSRRV